jgi:hypothetical protein
MADNFFAMLEDGSVRRIILLQNIENDIRSSFMNYGPNMLVGKDEVAFDGNYRIDEDEIMYVIMALPNDFNDVANNAINIPVLDIQTDKIKALFWFEGNTYYFQNFDNRKMLRHRNVLFYNNQTFDKLTSNAFIVDNGVSAIYEDGKFYFPTYPNANKIFSLADFYHAATNEDLTTFGAHNCVSISDPEWFLESNSVIRKQVTLLQKSALLDDADTKQIKKSAKKFKLVMELDGVGKIVFPRNRKACKEILFFLNENYYVGLITKKHYRTNSKRVVDIEQ